MDTTLSLFNQINSLSYWFLHQTNYKSSVRFDADNDEYFVTIKKNNEVLYSYCISTFSKKNRKFLQFELQAIVNQLLHLKQYNKAS